MGKFREKWSLIKQVLKNDNSLIITYHDNQFGFDYAGNSLMFGQLFQDILSHTDKWYKEWLDRNTVKDELARTKLDLYNEWAQQNETN